MLVKVFVENFNRNFVEVCRRNKVRTLTSQSELPKLLEELFVRSAADPCWLIAAPKDITELLHCQWTLEVD